MTSAARQIVFVCPRLTGESLRAARALKQMDSVRLFVICAQSPAVDINKHKDPLFADLILVGNIFHADQLLAAARQLMQKHGALERLVTVQETLLLPVAQAGETLRLPGLGVAAARRTLDKTRCKQTLRDAGIGVALDRVITSATEADAFVNQVGFPIVLKPPGGSGALATWRIRNQEQLRLALELLRPDRHNPVLAEDYLEGRELCIDTITLAGEPRLHALCRYSPSILEALERPVVQWRCVIPRETDDAGCQHFIKQGLQAVRALSPGNAFTHMEGFLLDDGRVRFTDATLRPAGARIGPMFGYAYGFDSHRAWAGLTLDGRFDGPRKHLYAVGTIFLRGPGAGRIESVKGLQTIKQHFGELVVDSRLPRIGAAKAATYTSDGFITLRHPDTQVVNRALDTIARTVVIGYTRQSTPKQTSRHPHPPTAAQPSHLDMNSIKTTKNTMIDNIAGDGTTLRNEWAHRLDHIDSQRNRPIWEDDANPTLDTLPPADKQPSEV